MDVIDNPTLIIFCFVLFTDMMIGIQHAQQDSDQQLDQLLTLKNKYNDTIQDEIQWDRSRVLQPDERST